MNYQKGAVSTAVAASIVAGIIVVAAIAYWYIASNPGTVLQTGTEATTTSQGSTNGSSDSSVTTTTTGNKVYSNFSYGYAISFPPDAQNRISTAADVSFGFPIGTSTSVGALRITVGTDVTQIAYCLTLPQGATAVATTSVNGTPFLSYVVTSGAPLSGTTYYRLLHKGPAGNACYDIRKTPQGSATVNNKLNGVLQSFTLITSA